MYIIAEIGQTHEGSVNQCIAFIDAIKKAGANAVKFQMHIADEESSPNEEWRTKFSFQDATRYDYWKRMEFSLQQWQTIRNYAKEKKLDFICSPFSEKAVDYLSLLNVDAWKVGSGEVISYNMIDKIIKTNKPIYISSGISDWNEIDEFIGYLKNKHANFTVMHCTTQYPTPLENVGINNITEMKKRYNTPVGLSDHSGTIYPALYAYFLEAEAIEIHVTLSRYMFGPDVSSSLDIDELTQLVKMLQNFEILSECKTNKNLVSQKLIDIKNIFSKKAIAKKNIDALSPISLIDFEFKKAKECGISELFLREAIGEKIIKNIKAGNVLTADYFDKKTYNQIMKKVEKKHNFYVKKAIQ